MEAFPIKEIPKAIGTIATFLVDRLSQGAWAKIAEDNPMPPTEVIPPVRASIQYHRTGDQ